MDGSNQPFAGVCRHCLGSHQKISRGDHPNDLTFFILNRQVVDVYLGGGH